MFVRRVKRKNGRILLRIVENLKVDGKVKQKFICGLGSFCEDDEEGIKNYTRMGEKLIIDIKNERRPTLPGMETAIHGRRGTKKKKGESSPSSLHKNLKEESRIRVGVDDVFANEFEQLGLLNTINSGYKEEESNKQLKEVVLARIDKPSSKKKSLENIERDKNKAFDLDSVYRTMDKLYKREDWVKERIGKKTLELFKEKIKVAFFDVTTLYFESFKPDDLRVSGYSKDNKVAETQVVFALMTTEEGLPLGYELFPGNTYEGGTLISAVDTLCKRYEVVDVSIVADRAMFTRSNLEALDKKKMNFIVSAKLKNMKKEMVEEILNDVDALKGEIESWIGEYKYNGRRLVVCYSKKCANKDRKDRQRLLERVRKKLDRNKVRVSDLVKNTGTKKYLKIERKNKEFATLDEEKIRREERWDGVFGIVSSHAREAVSGAEIFARYRGLWQIEDAFRVNKRDLKMRPIYHWTPKRIRSHLLICYMAYALVARVRHKLMRAKMKLSIERVREELGYVQASIVRDQQTGERFLLPSRVTDTQRAIYGALGMEIEDKVRPLK